MTEPRKCKDCGNPNPNRWQTKDQCARCYLRQRRREKGVPRYAPKGAVCACGARADDGVKFATKEKCASCYGKEWHANRTPEQRAHDKRMQKLRDAKRAKQPTVKNKKLREYVENAATEQALKRIVKKA